MGNAWFVKNVKVVDNADEELAALGTTDLRTTAIVRAGEFPSISNTTEAPSGATLTLTAYEANALSFESESKADGVAVFSDIYYPGWTCTIDGPAVDIHRADYVLRAVAIPAGKHKIEFRFDPQSVHTTETIAYVALALLAAAVLLGLVSLVLRKRKGASKQ